MELIGLVIGLVLRARVACLAPNPWSLTHSLSHEAGAHSARKAVSAARRRCWLMRRVHILGGGSLGSLFASHFVKAAVPTTLLLRPEAARLAGLSCTISVTAADSDVVDKQTLPCEPADGTVRQPFDILVVAVKAYDARSALEAVGTRVAEESTVILMCNGALAVADDLTDILGGASLLCATTTHGAWSRGPQDLHHAGKGDTWIGALPRAGAPPSGGGGIWHALFGDTEGGNICELPLSPHVAGAQELFASCGLGAVVEDPADTERRLWLKLAANAVLNPLTALWSCENGEVLTRAEGREAAQQVCKEVQAVCQHLAVSGRSHSLTPSDLTDFVHACAAANARNLSSMCMDVRNGRRTEIEQLNGWIERKSRGIAKGRGTLATSPSWMGKNGELADAVRKLHPAGVPPALSRAVVN